MGILAVNNPQAATTQRVAVRIEYTWPQNV